MSSTLAVPPKRSAPAAGAPEAAVAAVRAIPTGRLVRRYERLALALSRLAEREGEEPLVPDGTRVSRGAAGVPAGQRARTLADEARRLAEDVADACPRSFLAGQAGALAAVAATLAGERRSFGDLVRSVAGGSAVAPTTERLARCAEALERALPGRGHVVERLDAWRRRTALPPTRLPLLHELVAVTVAELRRRAARCGAIPAGEAVDVAFGRRAADDVVSRYVGDGVSRLDVGVDRGLTVCDLPRLLARETYPGRHLARVVLDTRVRQGAVAAERALEVALTPQAALLEGYATWAFDAVFPPAEAAAFAREELLPRAGVRAPEVDLEALFAAGATVDACEVEAEAGRLLATGASEQAAGTYLATSTLLPPSVAAARIPGMRSLLRRLRPCVRAAGREALRPWIAQDAAAGLAAVLAADLDPVRLAPPPPAAV